jgi:hypothetical protein
MKEEFLHYLWKYRLLRIPLITTNDQLVEVIKPGSHNHDAGPDFIDARLKIGDTLWAGNVEIHALSSSWYEHGHDKDPAYDNVILHVVLSNDKPAVRTNGQSIPCLECDNLIPASLYDKYKLLMNSRLWIPCARIIQYCPEITINSWIEYQLVERLESRSKQIEEILGAVNNDWEEAFYRLLAWSFGLKINAIPFELLASSLPYKILSKHKDQPLQVDALIFGQAGFLESDYSDHYPQQLKKEYEFLRRKYELKSLGISVWKFLRLRPPAFPTIRLSQFSCLIQKTSGLLSAIIEEKDTGRIASFFNVKAGEYWINHYRFDRQSKDAKVRVLGNQAVGLILINAVAPMLFLYGRHHQYEEIKNKAFLLLEELPAEDNAVITKWKSIGIKVNDAFTSQAVLNLKKLYCDHKRCLYCRIGNELLR